MDLRALLDRVVEAVDNKAYLTPSSHVEPRQRDAMAQIGQALQQPGFEPDQIRQLAERLHREGRIDRVHKLSAMHVIAASPRVADYSEAARLVGEQEMAALQLGGPGLSANLASVDRHRGVLAFLVGSYEVALDYFTRALERQHTAENLSNILCTLIRLHEVDEAIALLGRVRSSFPRPLVEELEAIVERDPDLALLCEEAP